MTPADRIDSVRPGDRTEPVRPGHVSGPVRPSDRMEPMGPAGFTEPVDSRGGYFLPCSYPTPDYKGGCPIGTGQPPPPPAPPAPFPSPEWEQPEDWPTLLPGLEEYRATESLGLPIRGEGRPGYEHLVHGSASVLFLAVHQLRFARAREVLG